MAVKTELVRAYPKDRAWLLKNREMGNTADAISKLITDHRALVKILKQEPEE